MGNSEHLKTFSLDASHLNPKRTHWHPWNCQTSDVGPFRQKTLDRRSRHMPFNDITLHHRGMARSLLRAYTTRLLHGIHVLGDMVLNAVSR